MNIKQALVVYAVIALMAFPASAYNGSRLSREPVDDFTLIDQHGENYSLYNDSNEVVVISFIFTRCPDVCPVLTQLIKGVESSLTETELEDVTFISVTVDPKHDSSEALKKYTELHGVEWPHLTSDEPSLRHVWDTFGLVVEETVIDAHVMDYQPREASLTTIDTQGNSTVMMAELSGWALTELMAEQGQWEVNASMSQYGHYVSGFNGIEGTYPDWVWELNLWNESNASWDMSEVGVDSVDVFENPHLMWMPSSMNRTNLSAPSQEGMASMTVNWPNGSSDTQTLSEMNGYTLTLGALNGAEINSTIEEDPSFGHYLTTLNNETAPSNYTWWWNLYAWNNTNMSWDSTNVGMDGISEPEHLAWAPSTINASSIPWPVSTNASDEACNGHGWVMGSGNSAHCMCDEGYGWDGNEQMTCVPELTEEYTVGHSTITYILNPNRQPEVAWPGDNWRVEDFTSDVREMLDKHRLGDNDPMDTPALSVVLTSTAIGAAIIMRPQRDEAKGEKESSTPDDTKQSSHSLVLRRI
ncbi:MAG: SCO family protein [Candidatus Poseidonia sp.]|nr:SCO family protein [Poseidonia sp.]